MSLPKVIVQTRCQACKRSMPDDRADSWCFQCATQSELDMIYGDDDCDSDGDWLNDLTCERCDGSGSIEYAENPDVWGEDCPSEKDHLVTCPDCQGRGWIGSFDAAEVAP